MVKIQRMDYGRFLEDLKARVGPNVNCFAEAEPRTDNLNDSWTKEIQARDYLESFSIARDTGGNYVDRQRTRHERKPVSLAVVNAHQIYTDDCEKHMLNEAELIFYDNLVVARLEKEHSTCTGGDSFGNPIYAPPILVCHDIRHALIGAVIPENGDNVQLVLEDMLLQQTNGAAVFKYFNLVSGKAPTIKLRPLKK